jgi:dUTPase
MSDIAPKIEIVSSLEELGETDRGANGFGSTGR